VKRLVALLAASLLLWSWVDLCAATKAGHPKTDAADLKPVLAAASAPATTHGAGVPALPLVAETSAVAAGHSLFNDNCEHCHGPDAVTGVEQRNLRHLAVRYGSKMDQVFLYTVTHGRPTKGMPNWSGILTQAQFRNILAYLHSIQEH
jgi:polar amino acid transport system substrate-binding protein